MTEPLPLAPGEDETLDELLRGRIRLLQPRRGARVSLDALLLADFALRGRAPLGRVLDIGCGGGVIALALALGDPEACVVGLEISSGMAALARRNAALNHVAARMRIVEGDVSNPRRVPLEPATFDLVVANPPFFPEGGGRVPKGAERALARQELACTLPDTVATARRFLRPRGRVALVFPAERVSELVVTLVGCGLRPRTLRAVHPVSGEPARRILVEAVRDYRGGATVLPPLVVHGDDRRSYSPEAARILGE